MSKQIRVVSDGTTFGTKVLDQDGNEIKGIKAVYLKVDADSPGDGMTAMLEITLVEVDVVATVDAIPQIEEKP